MRTTLLLSAVSAVLLLCSGCSPSVSHDDDQSPASPGSPTNSKALAAQPHANTRPPAFHAPPVNVQFTSAEIVRGKVINAGPFGLLIACDIPQLIAYGNNYRAPALAGPADNARMSQLSMIEDPAVTRAYGDLLQIKNGRFQKADRIPVKRADGTILLRDFPAQIANGQLVHVMAVQTVDTYTANEQHVQVYTAGFTFAPGQSIEPFKSSLHEPPKSVGASRIRNR